MLAYLASKVYAYPATPKSVFVWLRQLVVSFTVSLARVIPPPSSYKVLFMGYKLKMVRVATTSILANRMVNHKAILQFFNQPSIYESVHQERLIRHIPNSNPPITTDVSSTLPNPATVTSYHYIANNNSNGGGF